MATEAGSAEGSLVPGHVSHRGGKHIDLRYVDDNGNPIQGARADLAADADCMRDIFRMARSEGMTQIYLGDEDEWRDWRHTLSGTPSNPAGPHENHFHLSIPNPISLKQ